MPTNNKLTAAKRAKNDEFFTRYEDIERELVHYHAQLRSKSIYCNCNDLCAEFWKYFAQNFDVIGLKGLIATSYTQETEKQAYKIEMWRDDITGEKLPPVRTPLEGDGDFRSQECVELLKKCDVVVTNPPFSLLREFVAQLAQNNKQFIIVGNQNAVTYRELFPLIKNDEMWLGFGFKGGAAHFINRVYTDYATASDHQEGMIRVSGVVWFTNIQHGKRNEPLQLVRRYADDPNKYRKYDNYHAINVNKTADIPFDYDGAMGVPITFLDKYCPEQFEILGATESEGRGFSGGLWDAASGVTQPVVGGERIYKRLFIRRRIEDAQKELSRRILAAAGDGA